MGSSPDRGCYDEGFMGVPILDLQRQHGPLAGELTAAFERVLRSGQFIGGPEVERFEAAAAAVAGTRFAIGVSSGTDAILVALMALGIGPGDEVICPTFTFFATAGCVARVGARPVFADSRAECLNIDPEGIEPLITARTKALLPVHLFGQPADMDPILEIARRRGIPVIEDAAQAFGASYGGKPVGSLGDLATVSFFPTKNLGALGDAGLVLTNDHVLAEKVRLLRNHGARERYFHSVVGGNFRLDALHAALLSVKLPHLAEYTAARQRHAGEYNRMLAPLNGSRILLPCVRPGRSHIVNQYTVRVCGGRRDGLSAHLRQRGIDSAIYYPLPLHAQECFRDGALPSLPVAEAASREVLSLPVFPEMTAEEQGAVAAAISEFFGEEEVRSPKSEVRMRGLRSDC
jgi:dTDP-4-amino-4,6-dideoxygalactose transaminase